MHPKVYTRIIYNSQIMETAQMSTDWWMDKEDVAYIYNGILLSHRKEWNLAICYNKDGAREYNAKWNKLEKDIHHMISLICGIWETKQMSKQKKWERERNQETDSFPFF